MNLRITILSVIFSSPVRCHNASKIAPAKIELVPRPEPTGTFDQDSSSKL